MRVLGCDATSQRVTLHLSDDTPLDVARLVVKVAESKGRWKLTPDRKLSTRFDDASDDAIERVGQFLRALEALMP
jgi:transcription-repair coupling factor (superfamily II helicase)